MAVIWNYFIFFFASICSVSANSANPAVRKCFDPNEKYYGCKPCSYTCESLDISCASTCFPGCECKENYVRKNFIDHTCVAINSCPTCPNGEKYDSCGPYCPITCENVNGPILPCPDRCVEGCFCEDGLVRNTKTGKCVLPVDCPNTTPLCSDPNTEYVQCGTTCPITCKNKNNPPNPSDCPQICISGCFCMKGFVRDEDTALCVLPKDCPFIPTCNDPNAEYTKCGTSCPITCGNKDNPPKTCAQICVQGCFCKKGYVKNEATGKCVLPKLCPNVPVCSDPNAEYLQCKRCVGSCDDSNPICDKSCNPSGCYCKLGFVKKSKIDSTCIIPDNCPPPKCTRYEFWSEKCPVVPETCENPENLTYGTKPGCCCIKPNYVRRETGGKCVLRNTCI